MGVGGVKREMNYSDLLLFLERSFFIFFSLFFTCKGDSSFLCLPSVVPPLPLPFWLFPFSKTTVHKALYSMKFEVYLWIYP